MSGSRPNVLSNRSFKHHRAFPKFIRPIFIILLPLLLISFLSTSAMAASATFAWDPNTDDIDGYMLMIRAGGVSYNFSAPVWVGVTTTCRVSGLVPGTTYHLVVRAYKEGRQSGNSNEIAYTPSIETASNTTNDSNIKSAVAMITITPGKPAADKAMAAKTTNDILAVNKKSREAIN